MTISDHVEGSGAAGQVAVITRAAVEDFLHDEAALLDEWRLDEWLTLFEPEATYRVPSTDDPFGDPRSAQFLIADDFDLLSARVKRLKSKNAHAENPHSHTHRIITNVRVAAEADDAVRVHAAFLVHRIKDGHVDPYLGHYEHILALESGRIRFRARRAVLDVEVLKPAGRISFIL